MEINNNFYNTSDTLSYNGIINFIFGARGPGKSYAVKKRAIMRFKKYGEKFAYVRRYKDDIDASKNTYFDDIAINMQLEVKCFADTFYIRDILDKVDKDGKHYNPNPWEEFGCCISLSESNRIRSRTFVNYSTIILEEFVNEKASASYLRDEVSSLMSIWTTISRGMCSHSPKCKKCMSKCKVLAVSNQAHLNNPYLLDYKVTYSDIIYAQHKNGIIRRNRGKVIFHFINNHSIAADELINELSPDNSQYAAFATSNEWMDYSKARLSPKPSDAKYNFTLTKDDKFISIYYSRNNNIWWCNTKEGNEIYTTDGSHINEYPVISSNMLKNLKGLHYRTIIEFSDEKAKFAFLDIVMP